MLFIKRRESVKDAVRRRVGIASKREKQRAVKDAERILRRAVG